MTLLARAFAAMAAMGVGLRSLPPGISFANIHRRGKHKTRNTRLSGKRSKCKLRMARGAGSINAKADILQLARAGKFQLACEMANAHQAQCGEQLFPDFVLDAWMMEGDQ
jgi:hypothetical protein